MTDTPTITVTIRPATLHAAAAIIQCTPHLSAPAIAALLYRAAEQGYQQTGMGQNEKTEGETQE